MALIARSFPAFHTLGLRALSFALITVLGVLATPVSNTAYACSCAEPTDASSKTVYGQMDYVIEGEVLTVSPRALYNRPPMVKFKILREFKGDIPEREASFFYNPTLSTCGNTFEIGEKVMIGVFESGETLPRVAHICSQMAVRHFLLINNGYPR